MSYPLNNLPLFLVSLIFGSTMIFEGLCVVKFQKKIIPLPTRILSWIGVLLVGREKSTQWFAGKNTAENLRTYAIFALVLGTLLVVSGFTYLLF